VRVRALRQQHFRNLRNPQLTLAEGVTYVVGRNGAGKSNFIDALYLGGTGQLPRGSLSQSLCFGEGEGFVALDVEGPHGAAQLSIGFAPGRKRVAIDGRGVRSADLANVGGVVRIAPEDAELIHGSPGLRRGFLDALLSRLSLRYALMLRGYHRVVEQRNALLKSREAVATMGAWNERLCSLGAEIEGLRERLLVRLAPLAAAAYADVASGAKTFRVAYARAAGELPLPEALEQSRAEERARGVSVVGPHRDDLLLTLDGHDVRSFGSRGEARTASLALRMAEFNLLGERHGAPPLLLIDDLGAELDAGRRQVLLALAEQTPQAVVTGTDAPDDAPRVWRIEAGVIEVA
jgi:DNA replication and repair protein RecF